jgi:hypothetical protein
MAGPVPLGGGTLRLTIVCGNGTRYGTLNQPQHILSGRAARGFPRN